jgi:hypothetical protein
MSIKLLTSSIMLILGLQAHALDPIVTDSTTKSSVHTTGDITTTVKSPPPSAISPSLSGGNGNDQCIVGVSGAVQTQILGISMGSTIRDMNCERLKNSKTLFDMGMKVAAVSVLCQDVRVFDAMMMAGTPCPYHGIIGTDARIAWQNDELNRPKTEEEEDDGSNAILGGLGASILGFLLIL